MRKAQASLEALIALVGFLLVVGLFLAGAFASFSEAGKSNAEMQSVIEAEYCSFVLDSMYANSGAKVLGIKADCTAQGNSVRSDAMKSHTVPAETGTVLRNGQTILRVENERHYFN